MRRGDGMAASPTVARLWSLPEQNPNPRRSVMAVSKKRDVVAYKPPRRAGKENKNPRWYTPLMGGFYLLGLVWILVYYVSRAEYPLPIGNSNILVGFGFITVGFLMTTRWK
jgi:hypothetical protein